MTAQHAAGRYGPPFLGWLAMAGRHHHHHGRGRHRGGFGGPFGFGGPGGPFARGQRARRGDVRAALLTLLAEEPRNGYQLMQEIERRSEGVWRPSPGSVYPVLQLLTDEGLVRAEETDGRRVFQLTDAGRADVASREGQPKPWETVAAAAEADGSGDLRQIVFQVGGAVMQVAQGGTDEQIAAAKKVLVETRRSLYRILAEEAEEEDEPTTDG
jgi:DNA-binding PadR family transcriptional regulator